MGERSLTRAGDWRRVLSQGKRGRCNHLQVRMLRRASAEPSRLGLRVKAVGPARAVARNRRQRQLREAWQQVGPARGWDAVVFAPADSTGRNFQDLVACLERAIEEATGGVRE